MPKLRIRTAVLPLLLSLAGPVLAPSAAFAADTAALSMHLDEKRAHALLERAVKHVQEKGAAGLADFSRQGSFVDREIYVFAVSQDGTMLASGGSSAGLIGHKVTDQLDAVGDFKLASDLQSRVKSTNETQILGDLFRSYAPYFKMYGQYARDHEECVQMIQASVKTDSAFAEFIKAFQADPETKGQTLESLLICPVQRVPRYTLLIGEIIKLTHVASAFVTCCDPLCDNPDCGIEQWSTGAISGHGDRHFLQIQQHGCVFEGDNGTWCRVQSHRYRFSLSKLAGSRSGDQKCESLLLVHHQ